MYVFDVGDYDLEGTAGKSPAQSAVAGAGDSSDSAESTQAPTQSPSVRNVKRRVTLAIEM